jgi:hypothetical protein
MQDKNAIIFKKYQNTSLWKSQTLDNELLYNHYSLKVEKSKSIHLIKSNHFWQPQFWQGIQIYLEYKIAKKNRTQK